MAKYAGWFDVDGWPLAFIQSNGIYLSVTRYRDDDVAWRAHRTAAAAIRQAATDNGIAVAFTPFKGSPRWEPITEG